MCAIKLIAVPSRAKVLVIGIRSLLEMAFKG